MSADDACMHSSRERPGLIRVVLPAEPLAVRSTILRLLASLPATRASAELAGSAEIVLSEVLNNIVEHAYRGQAGLIELSLWPDPQLGLCCLVCDRGAAMPGEHMPRGDLPSRSGDSLPEGGFGWHLIHALARDIRYDRQCEQNRLSFRIP